MKTQHLSVPSIIPIKEQLINITCYIKQLTSSGAAHADDKLIGIIPTADHKLIVLLCHIPDVIKNRQITKLRHPAICLIDT